MWLGVVERLPETGRKAGEGGEAAPGNREAHERLEAEPVHLVGTQERILGRLSRGRIPGEGRGLPALLLWLFRGGEGGHGSTTCFFESLVRTHGIPAQTYARSR